MLSPEGEGRVSEPLRRRVEEEVVEEAEAGIAEALLGGMEMGRGLGMSEEEKAKSLGAGLVALGVVCPEPGSECEGPTTLPLGPSKLEAR